MILHRPEPRVNQDRIGDPRRLADSVLEVRLARLSHSKDDLAAAVATTALLLLRRLREERGA